MECPTDDRKAFFKVFFLLALMRLLFNKDPVPSPAQNTSSLKGSIITAQITLPSLKHASDKA